MGSSTIISDGNNKKVYAYCGGELPDNHCAIVNFDTSTNAIEELNNLGLWDYGDVAKYIHDNNYYPKTSNYPPSKSQMKIIKFIHRNTGHKFNGETSEDAYAFIGKFKHVAESEYHNNKKEKEIIEQQF